MLMIINDRHIYAAACGALRLRRCCGLSAALFSSKNTVQKTPVCEGPSSRFCRSSRVTHSPLSHHFRILYTDFQWISGARNSNSCNPQQSVDGDGQGVPADVFIRVGAAAVLGTGACLLLRDSHAHLQWT